MNSFSPSWKIVSRKAITYIPTLGSTVREGRQQGTWPSCDVPLYTSNFCSLTTTKSKHGTVRSLTTQAKCLNVVWSCNNRCTNCSQKADKDDESNHVLFDFQRGDSLHKSILFCTQLEWISQITGSSPLISTGATSSNPFQKTSEASF